MLKIVIFLSFVLAVSAFTSSRFVSRSKMSMAVDQPSMKKAFGAALIATSLLGSMPAFAKEGAGAKFGFFTNSDLSSPFVEEDREDPMFSPYSPYGDGSAAAYNARKGGAEELKYWDNKLTESIKRVDRIPGYVSSKKWLDIRSELTRYTYDMRNAMLRLAKASKTPEKATAAAKEYFTNLNDMTEWSIKKNDVRVNAAYEKSKSDMAAFKALL